ncbi:uncharacterized protein LOC144122834 [Amblyomma americanum]
MPTFYHLAAAQSLVAAEIRQSRPKVPKRQCILDGVCRLPDSCEYAGIDETPDSSSSSTGCMDDYPTSISLQSSLQGCSDADSTSPRLQSSLQSCSDVDFTCPLLQNSLQGNSSKEVFCAADEAALHKRIAEVEDELKSHERKLSICQRQKNAALQEKSALKRRTCHFLANDQLKSMERSTMRGTPWSTSTIEKGLKIRLSCGSRGYNVVREIGTPLPSERTLQRHLEGLKFLPGILHEILPSLSAKVNLMKDYEKHAVLILDEMQLTPGIAYDQGTETVIGKPTILLSNGTLPDNVMTTHGLVFMLPGGTTRWKQTVAYHLTSNSFCSNTVKHGILDIIKSCESIGIKIDAIVCDMGGGNQAPWKADSFTSWQTLPIC